MLAGTSLAATGSFTVHLPIFFWVGFRWDGHQGPEMDGMDPALNLAKLRKAQQELEETEDRARLAESALQH